MRELCPLSWHLLAVARGALSIALWDPDTLGRVVPCSCAKERIAALTILVFRTSVLLAVCLQAAVRDGVAVWGLALQL